MRVTGMGRKIFFDDDQQTPDTMNITYEYGSKALIWEMRIWNPYGMEQVDNGVAVYGTEGMVHIGRWNRRGGYKVFDKDGKQVLHEEEKESDFHAQNFLDCIRSRKQPNADIGQGQISAMHSHLGNIVARTGRNLEFDPGSETIVGDAAPNLFVRRRYRRHWATPQGA